MRYFVSRDVRCSEDVVGRELEVGIEGQHIYDSYDPNSIPPSSATVILEEETRKCGQYYRNCG